MKQPSQLLLTTRDITTLPATKLTTVPINLLSRIEVNNLFSTIFKQNISEILAADQNLISNIIAQCGMLPLSVSIIFKTKRNINVSWKEMDNAINESLHMTEFINENNPKLLQIIHASFSMLSNNLLNNMISFVVFPSTSIPSETLGIYWNMSPMQVQLKVSKLVNCSLLLSTDNTFVRLHDEMFRYLSIQHGTQIELLTRKLIDSYKAKYNEWHKVDDLYILKNLFYHLRAVEDNTTMKELILNYPWLLKKLKKCGILEILADFEFVSEKADDITALKVAIQDMKHMLTDNESWKEFGGQLIARLMHENGSQNIGRLLAQIKDYNKGSNIPWLLPVISTFHSRQAPKNEGHRTAVNCLAVIDEIDLALSGSVDGVIKRWEITSSYNSVIGEREFKPTTYTDFHDLPVHSIVCLKRNDIWYAISASTDRIVMWNVITGEELNVKTMRTSHLALCSDSKAIVVSGNDKDKDISTIRLMDLPTFNIIDEAECNRIILLSTLSHYIVTVSVDNIIRLWNAESLTCEKDFQTNSIITAVLLIEAQTVSDHAILIGTSTGTIQQMNINMNSKPVDIYQATSSITALLFDSESSVIYLGTKGGVVGKYSLLDDKLIEEKKACMEDITGIGLVRINNQPCVLLSSADTSVQLWRSFGNPTLFLFGGYRMRTKGLISFYNNHIAVTRDSKWPESWENMKQDRKTHLLCVYDLTKSEKFEPKEFALLRIYRDPSASTTTHFKDGALPHMMLNNATSYLIPTTIRSECPVNCLHLISSDRIVYADHESNSIYPFFLSSTNNNCNKLWWSNMKKQLEEQNSVISTIFVTEKFIFFGLHSGDIECWKLPLKPIPPEIAYPKICSHVDITTRKFTVRGHTQKISHLSVVDNYMASSSDDGTIRVWDVDMQKQLTSLACEMSPGPLDILVEGDCIFIIAFLLRINNLAVWKFNTKDKKEDKILNYIHPAIIHSVKSLPQHRGFVTVDNKGLLEVWNCSSNSPICSFRTLAPLTDCSINKSGLIAVVDRLHQFNVFCLINQLPTSGGSTDENISSTHAYTSKNHTSDDNINIKPTSGGSTDENVSSTHAYTSQNHISDDKINVVDNNSAVSILTEYLQAFKVNKSLTSELQNLFALLIQDLREGDEEYVLEKLRKAFPEWDWHSENGGFHSEITFLEAAARLDVVIKLVVS